MSDICGFCAYSKAECICEDGVKQFVDEAKIAIEYFKTHNLVGEEVSLPTVSNKSDSTQADCVHQAITMIWNNLYQNCEFITSLAVDYENHPTESNEVDRSLMNDLHEVWQERLADYELNELNFRLLDRFNHQILDMWIKYIREYKKEITEKTRQKELGTWYEFEV